MLPTFFWINYSNHKIIKYNSKGKFVLEFGNFGANPGQIAWPYKVASDSQGNIFVVDYHDISLVSNMKDLRSYYRVQKFSPEGKFIWSIGAPGKRNGEFNGSPSDIAADDDGNLYVLDRGNFRIQKFSPSGKFLLAFGQYGNGKGQFDLPQSLLIDNNSNIYVSDSSNYRISKFDRSGKYLLSFGQEGYNDGEFKSPYPSQIYFDKNKNICAMTSYSFYTSSKRRYIKCLVQKFDQNGKFKKKLYAMDRYYDDDTTYYLTYYTSDHEDNLYLFHSRDKSINKYAIKGAAINWASMSKDYYLEMRKPTEGYNNVTLYTTATYENTRSLSGWNPTQSIYLNYEQDDTTNIYLSNSLSATLLTGLRDDRTITTSTAWASWEGTRDIFTTNTNLQVRKLFDKTKNKDITYNIGFNSSYYNYKWTTKAPQITEPSTYSSLYTNANIDVGDFSDLELGYNKSLNRYETDSKYSNYMYFAEYPSDYIYLKYHNNF